MALRDTLRKAAGLLVEMPPEARPSSTEVDIDELLRQAPAPPPMPDAAPPGPPAARTVEQLLKESPGPNLEEIQAKTTAASPALPPDGEVEVGSIYQQAGVPASPFTAEQVIGLLESLPAEIPLETKRQTVRVTLDALGKSVGANPDTIVADASRKLAALTAYEEHATRQTQAFTSQAQQEIERLQAQIEDKRGAITAAGAKLQQITARCEAESHRLDEVLEFFSLDVPPSRHAPAPSAGEGKPPASGDQ